METKVSRTENSRRDDSEKQIRAGTQVEMRGGGTFKLRITREDGKKEEIRIDNLITDLGLDILVRNLTGINPINLTHIVLSDATSTPSPSETTMPGTNKWAVAASVTRPQARKVVWTGAFSKGAIVGTIGSLGLCSDSNGNNLFARVRIDPPKQVGENDTVEVEYALELNRQQ